MRKVILTAIGIAASSAAVPAAADVKGGVDAWSRGDYKAAVEQWRGPAVAGDADAQFNLGQAYKLGRGVPLDPAQAESWFQKAATHGHLQAQDNYGLALYQDHKLSDAVPWLEKSVARGEPRAQLVLGTMLFNGDRVGRDYPRAYALMTRAAAQGLPSASETLAQMDQYISPADREKGTALAQQYAAQAAAMPRPAGNGALVAARPTVRQTEVPPSRGMPTPAHPP
uniref:tetratricopeptide repeat protein n=1 Tax=Sphingomonas bacterium TaxID=1895847 RepID=UPI001576B605